MARSLPPQTGRIHLRRPNHPRQRFCLQSGGGPYNFQGLPSGRDQNVKFPKTPIYVNFSPTFGNDKVSMSALARGCYLQLTAKSQLLRSESRFELYRRHGGFKRGATLLSGQRNRAPKQLHTTRLELQRLAPSAPSHFPLPSPALSGL